MATAPKKNVPEMAVEVEEILTFDPKTSQAFCDSYTFGPEEDREQALGHLHLVIEVNNRDKSASDVADAIATVLQHTYYKGDATSPMRSFEGALSRTNEILADLAERGEISWIGKLHAIAAVVTGGELYVTQTGRAKAFLVRDGEITEVSRGLSHPEASTNPSKTFGNIASGELEEGDRVILGAPDLFDFLPPEKLAPLITDPSLTKGAALLRKRLPTDSQRPFCALILGYGDAAPTAVAPTMPMATTTAPAPAPMEDPAVITEAAGPKEALADLVKGPTSFIRNTREKMRGSLEKKLPAKFFARGSKKRSAPERESLDTLLPASAPLTTGRGGQFSRVLRNGATRFRNLPRRSKLFLSGAVLLAIVLIVSLISVASFRGRQQTNDVLAALLADAQRAEESAEASLIFNNRDEATAQLAIAEEKLAELKSQNPNAFTDEIAALEALIADLKDKLANVNTLENVTEIFDFATVGEGVSIQHIAFIVGGIAAVDTNNNTYLLSVTKRELTPLSTSSSNIGRIVTGVAFEEDKSVVYLTDTPGFANLDVTNGNLKTAASDGLTSGIVSIDNFGDFIYTLDSQADAINKHAATTSGYARGTSWVSDGTSVSGAVDFAIDGEIYVLYTNGTITRLLRGKKDAFSPAALTEPLSVPTRIVTEVDLDNLYVLDPGKQRVVVWGKDGTLVNQYTSPTFDNLLDLAVSNDEKKIYLLNGTKVYEIAL